MRTKGDGKGCGDMFVEFFADGKPHTAEELTKGLCYSRSSVTRHLKKNKALTSVNANGQYYVLPGMVAFNRRGLGRLDGKIFSKHGNLIRTIERLAAESSSGMTPGEIERLVGTNVQSQCLILFQKGKLHRKRYGKAYRYFSVDEDKRRRQVAAVEPSKRSVDLDDQLKSEPREKLLVVIKILLTFIHNPHFTPKSVALSLIRRGCSVTTEKVREVFETYDLAKKNS
jgi:hypothetical protein